MTYNYEQNREAIRNSRDSLTDYIASNPRGRLTNCTVIVRNANGQEIANFDAPVGILHTVASCGNAAAGVVDRLCESLGLDKASVRG